jgi:hypothetical protein
MVHATVAALSYGIPVKMYYRSPRQGVLTSVVGDSVFEGLYTSDQGELRAKKAQDISDIKAILTQ